MRNLDITTMRLGIIRKLHFAAFYTTCSPMAPTTVPNAPIVRSFEARHHLGLRLASKIAMEPGGDFFYVVGILPYVQEVVIGS